jgi:histone H3/H4
MYSRVGTPDRDDHYGKNTSRKEASQLVQINFARINKEVKDRAIKELSAKKDLTKCSPEEIWEEVQKTSADPREKRFSDRLNKLFEEKISFVESIGGRVSQDLTKDENFAAEIQRMLQSYDPEQPVQTVQEITRKLSNYLREHLTDQTYPGRDRLARKIMETIKQDSIIKNILA